MYIFNYIEINFIIQYQHYDLYIYSCNLHFDHPRISKLCRTEFSKLSPNIETIVELVTFTFLKLNLA